MGGAAAGARLDDAAARQKVLNDRAGQGVGGLDAVITVAREHRRAVLHAKLRRRQPDQPGAQFSPLRRFDGQTGNVPPRFERHPGDLLRDRVRLKVSGIHLGSFVPEGLSLCEDIDYVKFPTKAHISLGFSRGRFT
jgi:hypothetical protein